jgi:hypothetical protein
MRSGFKVQDSPFKAQGKYSFNPHSLSGFRSEAIQRDVDATRSNPPPQQKASEKCRITIRPFS